MTTNQKHPADKFNTEQVESLSSIIKKAQNTMKKVSMTYKKVKNNMCLVQKYEVLPQSELVDAHGNSINAAEETLFKVVMVGDRTDDYVMEVTVGDIVLVTHFVSHIHMETTLARTKDGIALPYYMVVALADIGAVVDYKKI